MDFKELFGTDSGTIGMDQMEAAIKKLRERDAKIRAHGLECARKGDNYGAALADICMTGKVDPVTRAKLTQAELQKLFDIMELEEVEYRRGAAWQIIKLSL